MNLFQTQGGVGILMELRRKASGIRQPDAMDRIIAEVLAEHAEKNSRFDCIDV